MSSSIMSEEMENATPSSSRRKGTGVHYHHHSNHMKSPEAVSSRKSTVTATTATISTAAESTTTGGGGKSRSSSRRTSSHNHRSEETKSTAKEEEPRQEEMITPEILNERMNVLLELLMAAKADNMEKLREVERKVSSKLGSAWGSSAAHPYGSSSSRSSSRRGKDIQPEEKEADGAKGNSIDLAGDIESILRTLEKARRDEPTTRKLEVTEGGKTTTIVVPLAGHSSSAGGSNGSYPRRNSTGSTTTGDDTPFSDVEFGQSNGNHESGRRKNGASDRIGHSQRSTPSSSVGRSREAPEARPASLSSSRRSASTGQRGGNGDGTRSGTSDRKHRRQRSAGGDGDLDAAIAPLSLSRARTAPHHHGNQPSVQPGAKSRSNGSPSPSQQQELPTLVDNVQDVNEDRLQRNIQMILNTPRSKKRTDDGDVLEPSPLPGSGSILRRQQEEEEEEEKDVLDEEEDDIISASLPKRFGGNPNHDSMSVVSDLTTPTVMTYRDPPSVAGGHDVPLSSSARNPAQDRMPKQLGVLSTAELTQQIQERRRRTRAELEEMNNRTKAAQQQALESRPSLEQGPPPPSRMDLVPGVSGTLTPLRASGGTPSSTSQKVDLEGANTDLGPLPLGTGVAGGAGPAASGTISGVSATPPFAGTRAGTSSPPGSGGVPFPTSLGRNVSAGGASAAQNTKAAGAIHRRSSSTTNQPSAVNDASRAAAAMRMSMPASGADRFASSGDKQRSPAAGAGHMKRHSAGGISSGGPIHRGSIPGQPPKPAKKPATDETSENDKPLTLDDFADTAESPNFFPTAVQDELSVYFEPTPDSSKGKSAEKGSKRSSVRGRFRLGGGSKEKKDNSSSADGDAGLTKKNESEEKSSGKGRRVSVGGAAAKILGGRNRRGSEQQRVASSSLPHQKPPTQTAGSILRAGGELSSRNLLASGSSSRGAALIGSTPRVGGGNLSASLHSAPPSSRIAAGVNSNASTSSSSANPIDVEGVVSTMGKDIDYIFRELSALEAEQDRSGSGGSGNGNHDVGVASIYPETAMSATARIKYSLGSVASVLRKGDAVEGVANPSASAASRGQFSQYRRRGSQANLLASQRFLTHHGKKVSWGRIGSSGMELAPLADVGEGTEEDEEAASESQSRAASSATPRRDPLLIDEDGFIISSASVSSSANDSSQQDEAGAAAAGADKKTDDRHRGFGVQQRQQQQSPSWWGGNGGGAGSPRSAKGRVAPREEESIREPKSADVEEKVITGPGEAPITSMASPVVPTAIGGPAGNNSKESRIDAVEEATKNRIAMLRKLVEDRNNAGGSGHGDGLAAKLDFVEMETMKQIGKLRDRLTSQRELGATRVSV